MLTGYGIRVEYDVIAKRLRISMSEMHGSPDNALNVAMSKIISLATLNGISTGSIPSYVATIADHHQVNEIADWIMLYPWDGKDRIPTIVATLTTREDFPYDLKRTLIYCWLLSAVAAALLPSGFFARGVLTLQGPQGIGKTSWIRALVTPKMLQDTSILLGHHLDAGNKDSIITAISHWIVELGELDSSFKKDIARLKGFITGASDKVRRPYALADSEYQRRTVFCATVNEENFLVDSTGNSRWWTLPVTEIDYQHKVDMQQVFAQLAVDLNNGAQWWLAPEQEVLLAEQNREHRAVNVIEEKLLSAIDISLPDAQRSPLSSTEVLQRLGYDKPSNPQCRECGSVLREHFGQPKKINGTMKWRVPLRSRYHPSDPL
jgi:putative DNA primase/helicase